MLIAWVEQQSQIPKKSGWLQGLRDPSKLSKKETLVAHHSSVLWYLQSELSDVSSVLYHLQDLRLKRGQEKRNIASDFLTKNPTDENSAVEIPESELQTFFTQQQLQELEQENDVLLQEFEHTMERLRDTGKSLADITRLQSEISAQLSIQSSAAEKLYDDALNVMDSLSGGNQQLIKAKSRSSRTARLLFCIFTVMGLLLLSLDRIV